VSSGIGYPDWQKIQQWLGAPLDQATAAAIGAGAINLGPYNLASWASLVVAIKPTGGSVTITVKQKISGGPATLELSQQVVVNAGSTVFEAFVLLGDAVSVTLQGSAGGETVDYALYPSNTTTNAQVITNATINVQKDDVLVAAEQTLDFLTAALIPTITDDAGNTRVKISFGHRLAVVPIGVMAAVPSGADTVITWAAAIVDNGAFWAAGQPTRLTAPAAGTYAVVVNQQYALNATGVRGLVFKVNGAFVRERSLAPGGDGAVSGGPTHMEILKLAAGDYVEAFTYQASGGGLALNGASFAIVQLA
jgi:hypothetical protein